MMNKEVFVRNLSSLALSNTLLLIISCLTVSLCLYFLNIGSLLIEMKISNLIVGGFIALSSIAAFSLAANAGYTCRKDYLGRTVCSGYQNGNRINTTTRKDYLGRDVTTGTVNGQSFRETCRTDYLGRYVCN